MDNDIIRVTFPLCGLIAANRVVSSRSQIFIIRSSDIENVEKSCLNNELSVSHDISLVGMIFLRYGETFKNAVCESKKRSHGTDKTNILGDVSNCYLRDEDKALLTRLIKKYF